MIIAMYRDSEGMPRAWASGPREAILEVKNLATRQIEVYCKERTNYLNDDHMQYFKDRGFKLVVREIAGGRIIPEGCT